MYATSDSAHANYTNRNKLSKRTHSTAYNENGDPQTEHLSTKLMVHHSRAGLGMLGELLGVLDNTKPYWTEMYEVDMWAVVYRCGLAGSFVENMLKLAASLRTMGTGLMPVKNNRACANRDVMIQAMCAGVTPGL